MKKVLLILLASSLIVLTGCVKITPLEDGAFIIKPEIKQEDIQVFKEIGLGFIKSAFTGSFNTNILSGTNQ